MRSYLDLANNAYIADANFHYTECGMAKLLQEYSSLQCYIVLSTIAQVLRKMSLKILAS